MLSRKAYRQSQRSDREWKKSQKIGAAIEKKKEKEISRILKESGKIVKLIRSGWISAEDVLKVFRIMTKEQYFMKALASMTINNYDQCPRHMRHVGLA